MNFFPSAAVDRNVATLTHLFIYNGPFFGARLTDWSLEIAITFDVLKYSGDLRVAFIICSTTRSLLTTRSPFIWSFKCRKNAHFWNMIYWSKKFDWNHFDSISQVNDGDTFTWRQHVVRELAKKYETFRHEGNVSEIKFKQPKAELAQPMIQKTSFREKKTCLLENIGNKNSRRTWTIIGKPFFGKWQKVFSTFLLDISFIDTQNFSCIML